MEQLSKEFHNGSIHTHTPITKKEKGMRPRVFVSSVMDGFEEYRQAAREGIIAAGGMPVLVEDFPSLALSPRTACLDGVASCDIYLGMVGNRGGWTAPSGKLVVEEEYEEARRRRRRTLAFIQQIDHDDDAKRLVRIFSDYIEGMFRQTFSRKDDLRTAIENALKPLIQHYEHPEADTTVIEERLRNPHQIQFETVLRFVLVPERSDELLDPVSLESPELEQELLEIGHSLRVKLFSFRRPKKPEVRPDEIIFLQADERRSHDGLDEVRLEITTQGIIVIDTNVSGRAGRKHHASVWSSHVILENDVLVVLEKCFAFARDFFDAKDPYKRYDRLFYNVALSGTEYKTLMREPPLGNSYSMPFWQENRESLIAFERPRLITRDDLVKSDKEVQASLTLFRRRLNS